MIVPWVKKFLTWKLFSQKKLLVLGPITFIPFWLLALGPIFFVKSKFNMLLPLVLIMPCENMIITQLCRAWISDVVQIVLVSKVILLVLLSNFAQCWVPWESVLWGSSVHKAMWTAQNLKVPLIHELLKLMLLSLYQILIVIKFSNQLHVIFEIPMWCIHFHLGMISTIDNLFQIAMNLQQKAYDLLNQGPFDINFLKKRKNIIKSYSKGNWIVC